MCHPVLFITIYFKGVAQIKLFFCATLYSLSAFILQGVQLNCGFIVAMGKRPTTRHPVTTVAPEERSGYSNDF
jgi:hypothetical protein